MPKDKSFRGPFAGHLQALLGEKHALGYKYQEPERLMYEFDRLSLNHDCSNGLPKELILEFVSRKPNWHQATQEHHVSISRTIATYLTQHGIPAYVIDKTMVTDLHEGFKPYIFTHKQIKNIFEAADCITPNSVRTHLFYPALLRVQYGCGLRISETLNMRMKDVDLGQKLLHVYDSKNHKDRTVPMSDSVNSYCRWYAEKIHPIYNSNDYFFQSHWGDGHYEKNAVSHYFRELLFRCGIPHGGRTYGGPHLHCLRHTFCVHSLEKMLKEGIPHQTALPLVSTYMGHYSLSATGRYLRLTAEAFPELTRQIEAIYSDILPELEVKTSYEEAD